MSSMLLNWYIILLLLRVYIFYYKYIFESERVPALVLTMDLTSMLSPWVLTIGTSIVYHLCIDEYC